MNNNDSKNFVLQNIPKTGTSRWCDLDSISRHAIGNQQCFYCNFALECGEQECIWHEDSR